MKNNKRNVILILWILLMIAPSFLSANDGAAEIALGGIVLKQEHRIAMVKEKLYVSKKTIRVEYVFKNDSDQDIKTEIAFPIPEYFLDPEMITATFNDFKINVHGSEIPYQVEYRAFFKGTEYTKLLKDLNIDIGNFGKWHLDNTLNKASSQMDKLTEAQLQPMIKCDLIEPVNTNNHSRDLFPKWTVKKIYHWTQVFPAKQEINIEHEYTPQTGETIYLSLDGIIKGTPFSNEDQIEGGCPDLNFQKAFQKAAKNWESRGNTGKDCPGSWVRYILTTANTWKTPILNFELIVERNPGELMTFCWDGPVEKVGPNTFRAVANNFIPNKELTVYFVSKGPSSE